MASIDRVDQLWALTGKQGLIDRNQLCAAVEGLDETALDVRSRQLVQASRLALAGKNTDETAFPSLFQRVGEPMRKTTIEQYCGELAADLREPARLIIGGASALILQDLLSRATEDIHVVDDVPRPLRDLHDWRNRAELRYGLYLAHFQSHYLPKGWEDRLHSRGKTGKLDVWLVDPIDIFVGKLFSKREKDLDDLRALSSQLGREEIDQRLGSAGSWAADSDCRSWAERNYSIVYGHPLPR